MKKPFAKLKKEFIMTPQEIQDFKALPDNLPETTLTKKQKDLVNVLYHKYVENKLYKGWGLELYKVEQQERWPSGPRVKEHEAKRMILNHLVEANRCDNMTAEQAARHFYGTLTCREAYTIIVQKIYEIK